MSLHLSIYVFNLEQYSDDLYDYRGEYTLKPLSKFNCSLCRSIVIALHAKIKSNFYIVVSVV